MIANVFCLLALSASVAFSLPCNGLFNNVGTNVVSFDSSNLGLNSQKCASSSFGPAVLGAQTRSVGFVNVNSRPAVSNNNGFATSFSLDNGRVQNSGLYNGQLVNAFPLVSSQVSNGGSFGGSFGGSYGGSSSFGPAVFAADSRSVNFPNARSGATTGSSLSAANALFNSVPVASVSSVGSGAFNAVPTQVSADSPVLSSGCNGQMSTSSPVFSGSNVFSTGASSRTTPLLVSEYGNQMNFPSLVSSPSVVSGSLTAVPSQVSSDAAVLAANCNNQMVSNFNSGVFGKCGY